MLPLKLTIQGINSYQKKAVVDFEQLSKGGLFGIFGEVGSGKSTMIDAITLALFDRAEKLGARDKRNYNLMNLQSQTLLVDFEFLAGDNLQDKYRFVVEGKRARKFNEVKSFERKKYKWVNNKWLPNEHLDAEEILGLSYENFRRTVIIPQGKFQEFMQLTDTDRTRMLKEIFSLHRFEFANQTLAIEKKTVEAKNQLIGELGTVETVDQTVIDEHKKQLKLEVEIRDEIDAEYQKLLTESERLSQLKTNLQNLEKQKIAEAQLQRQADSFKQLQEQINQFADCQRQFKPLIDKQAELKNTKESTKNELADCNQQLQSIDKEEIQIKQQNKILSEQFGNAQNIQNHIDDWQIVIRLKNNENQQHQLVQNAASQNNELANTKTKQQQLKNQLLGFKQQLLQQQNNSQQLAELQQLKSWLEKQDIFQHRHQTLQAEAAQTQQQLNQLIEGKNKTISVFVKGELLEQLSQQKIQQAIESLRQETQRLKTSASNITQQINQLKVEQQLADFAHNLTEGQACALCGATHHPKPLSIEHNHQQLVTLQGQLRQLDNSQIKYEKCLNELQQIVSDFRAKNPLLKQIHEKIEQAAQQVIEHEKTFTWPNYNALTLAEVSGQISEMQQQLQKQIQLQNQLQSKETELEAVQQSLEQNQLQLNQTNQKLAVLKGTQQSLQTNVKTLDKDSYLNISISEIEQKIAQLSNAIIQLNQHQTQLDILKEKRIEWRAKASNVQQQLVRIKQQLNVQEEEINHLIQLSSYDNIGQILRVLEGDLDVTAEQQKINQFNDQLKELQWQIQQLQQVVASQNYRETEHQKIISDCQQQKLLLNQKQQLLGELKLQVSQMQKAFERKKHIQEKLNVIEARLIDLKTLKDMFRASGFVNFVSGIYLNNLCAQANKRFVKLSRNQLSLEVNERNQFEVRDHMNGGQTRGIKTLSGGQTFQAALCLALALAEQVNRRQYQQKQFFFIDEGFGSLDKESLQAVYQSLQNLAKQGKVIGVISHMESLQEDISTYLKITNGQNGSQINPSWG